MNSLVTAGALSLAALIPILFVPHPIAQAALLWIAMQLAIQISFHFVPNALKVAVIACVVVLAVQLFWRATGGRRTEGFHVDGCTDVGDGADCWTDPDKKLDRNVDELLKNASEATRDIEEYLRVDQPDRGVVI